MNRQKHWRFNSRNENTFRTESADINDSSDFGKKLRSIRLHNKLSMREAARRIGVPETTYREWEYGRKILGPEPYKKIAAAFGVSITTLFGEDGDNLELEQRLNRAKADIEFVQNEIQKMKK